MAATCTIQAAKDLYTTTEAQAVRNAWIAVNVEVPITSVPSKKPPLKPSSSTLKSQKRAKQKKATKKQAPMDSVSTGNVLGVINSTSMNSTQMPLNLTQLVDAAGLPTLPIEKTSASLTTTSTYYASSSTTSTYASSSSIVRNVTEATDLF
jgi:Zn-dependent metalloprotease